MRLWRAADLRRLASSSSSPSFSSSSTTSSFSSSSASFSSLSSSFSPAGTISVRMAATSSTTSPAVRSSTSSPSSFRALRFSPAASTACSTTSRISLAVTPSRGTPTAESSSSPIASLTADLMMSFSSSVPIFMDLDAPDANAALFLLVLRFAIFLVPPIKIVYLSLRTAPPCAAASLALYPVMVASSFIAQVTTLISQSFTSRRWRMPFSS